MPVRGQVFSTIVGGNDLHRASHLLLLQVFTAFYHLNIDYYTVFNRTGNFPVR